MVSNNYFYVIGNRIFTNYEHAISIALMSENKINQMEKDGSLKKFLGNDLKIFYIVGQKIFINLLQAQKVAVADQTNLITKFEGHNQLLGKFIYKFPNYLIPTKLANDQITLSIAQDRKFILVKEEGVNQILFKYVYYAPHEYWYDINDVWFQSK